MHAFEKLIHLRSWSPCQANAWNSITLLEFRETLWQAYARRSNWSCLALRISSALRRGPRYAIFILPSRALTTEVIGMKSQIRCCQKNVRAWKLLQGLQLKLSSEHYSPCIACAWCQCNSMQFLAINAFMFEWKRYMFLKGLAKCGNKSFHLVSFSDNWMSSIASVNLPIWRVTVI